MYTIQQIRLTCKVHFFKKPSSNLPLFLCNSYAIGCSLWAFFTLLFHIQSEALSLCKDMLRGGGRRGRKLMNSWILRKKILISLFYQERGLILIPNHRSPSKLSPFGSRSLGFRRLYFQVRLHRIKGIVCRGKINAELGEGRKEARNSGGHLFPSLPLSLPPPPHPHYQIVSPPSPPFPRNLVGFVLRAPGPGYRAGASSKASSGWGDATL